MPVAVGPDGVEVAPDAPAPPPDPETPRNCAKGPKFPRRASFEIPAGAMISPWWTIATMSCGNWGDPTANDDNRNLPNPAPPVPVVAVVVQFVKAKIGM